MDTHPHEQDAGEQNAGLGRDRTADAPGADQTIRGVWTRLRAADGLRGQLTRAAVVSVALAVVAGSTAGAVTLVTQTVGLSASTTASEDDAQSPDGPDGIDEDVATAEDDATRAPDTSTDEDETGGTDPSSDDEADGGDTADGSSAEVPLTFAQAISLHGAPDYATILTRRYPGAQWSLNGNDVDGGFTWNSSGRKPTQAELDAHWPFVAAELAEERAARRTAEAAATAARAAELEAHRGDPSVQALLDSFDPRIIWGPSPDYAAILTRRFPGAQWSLNGNDPAGGLVWHSSGSKPTKSQLDAMWADVAREMALEMDPKELARWAGTGDQIYVDGVLRPRGWVGGANDPQPEPLEITEDNWRYLPQLPNTNDGSPVGSIDIYKDPTGGKNFEQQYGIDLGQLVRLISEAHGNWGGQYGSLGLGMNGDRTVLWYSNRVDRAIVVNVLTSLGALPADRSTPEPEAEPEAEEDAGPSEETSDAVPDDDDEDEDAEDAPPED